MSHTPPILAAIACKKPRARKARAPTPKEIDLHITIAKLLKDHALPDWTWTHIPTGEHRDIRTAAKLKAMGTRRGWPDFVLLPPLGCNCFLELKRPDGKLTREQETFRVSALKRGDRYVTASTIDQALIALDQWGCLRVEYPIRRTECLA